MTTGKQDYTLIQKAASLLRINDLYEERADVIEHTLGVKKTGLRELTDAQLRELIFRLRMLGGTSAKPEPRPQLDSADKMRKTIISNAYQMKWASPGDWRTAVASIDEFCMSAKGLFKKKLNDHTDQELNKVVTQFKSMTKTFLKQVAKK